MVEYTSEDELYKVVSDSSASEEVELLKKEGWYVAGATTCMDESGIVTKIKIELKHVFGDQKIVEATPIPEEQQDD
jgi:hypothetical protein